MCNPHVSINEVQLAADPDRTTDGGTSDPPPRLLRGASAPPSVLFELTKNEEGESSMSLADAFKPPEKTDIVEPNTPATNKPGNPAGNSFSTKKGKILSASWSSSVWLATGSMPFFA